MKLLTKKQQDSDENAKICYICKTNKQKNKNTNNKKNENKYLKGKKYWKVRDCCNYTGKYRDARQSICNLKYSVSTKIPNGF